MPGHGDGTPPITEKPAKPVSRLLGLGTPVSGTRSWPEHLSALDLGTIQFLSETRRMPLSKLSRNRRDEIIRLVGSLHNTDGLPIQDTAHRLGRSQSFLWNLCRALAIPTRTIDEANKLSAPTRSKYPRTPFSGSAIQRVYLKGFSMGDLNVAKVGDISLFISTTTTHPAF
jgi:hypothetical protein